MISGLSRLKDWVQSRVRPRLAARARPTMSVVLCGFLLAAAVGVGVALALYNLRERVVADEERRLQNLALILSEHTEATLQALELLQTELVDRIQLLSIRSPDDYRNRLRTHDTHLLLAQKIGSLPQAESVALIDAEGNLINFSRYWPIPHANVADHDYFQALKSDEHLAWFVGEPALDGRTGLWIIHIARKIVNPTGELLGLIVGSIQQEYFERLFKQLLLRTSDSVGLFRSDGVLLARYPHADQAFARAYMQAPLFSDRLASARQGVIRNVSKIDGQERLIAANRLGHYPLVVTRTTTIASILADWQTATIYLVGFGAGLILVIIGICALIVQRLREQRVLLHTAVNNMTQGLCMFDGMQRLILCNRRYAEMFNLPVELMRPGTTLQEILDHRIARGMYPGTDPEEYIRDCMRLAAENRPSRIEMDLPDGRTFALTRRPTGDGGWVATIEDVTELRRARAAAEGAAREAQSAHARLLGALDAMPEGVALFDAEDRYVLWNQRYAEIYAESRHAIVAGGRFEDTLRAGLAAGQYPEAEGREQEWLAQRMAQHSLRHTTHEQRLTGDRWVRIEERRTADGGSIGIRIDITEAKRREASFRLMLETNPVPMWIIDRETLQFLAVNNAATEHYGYSTERFLQMSLLDVVVPEQWESVRHATVTGAPDLAGQTRRHLKVDGSSVDVAVYTRSLIFNGRAACVVAVFDLTARKRAEAELENTREFLNMIVEHVPVGIVVKEPVEKRYVLVNRAAEEFWGISRDKMLGRRAQEILPEGTLRVIEQTEERLLKTRQPQLVDCVPVETLGRGTRLARIRRHMVLDRETNPQYLLSVIEDVTTQRRTEAQIAHMARHDSLTDLPNRAAFDDTFAEVLEQAKRTGEGFALFCIDLDRFKGVNDVFGHRIGDALLRELSCRMREAAGTAFLARFGSDEFNLITTEQPLDSASERLAARLQAAVAEDIVIEGIPLRVGLSIGAAMFPANGSDMQTLLAHADAALYRAKREGHGAVRFFDAEMDHQLHERRVLQQELKSALDRNEFTLHYQPQARIDGEIFGFEALVRWNHPTRGELLPSVFIPLAEECGLIGALSDWTVRQACREAASWPRRLQIAVNYFAQSVPPQRSRRAGAFRAAGSRACSRPARARNHRRGADRRLLAGGIDPAADQIDRRPDRAR